MVTIVVLDYDGVLAMLTEDWREGRRRSGVWGSQMIVVSFISLGKFWWSKYGRVE